MENGKIKKRHGFTLIELLVVISIIALLMSILTPSLGRAKKMAKSVLCLSNFRQWGLAWSMYSNDFNNNLPTGWQGNFAASTFWNQMKDGKGTCLYPYIEQDEKIRMCPEVRGPAFEVVSGQMRPTGIPGSRAGWGEWIVDGGLASPDVFKGDFGSYGINYFAAKHPTSGKYWNRFGVSGGDRIPLLAECYWPSSAMYDVDLPPAYEGQFGGGTGDMKRFVVNRHGGRTNMLFMDFSAGKVALKRLWGLKWHREFGTNNLQTRETAVWPDWMKDFPDK